jgi:NADPH:quinone reductase-like Zn-dependent oxidoreductase
VGEDDGLIRVHAAGVSYPDIVMTRGIPYIVRLAALTDLIDSGKLTSVIDRTYPLAQVPEALRHFGQGHTHGKIITTV